MQGQLQVEHKARIPVQEQLKIEHAQGQLKVTPVQGQLKTEHKARLPAQGQLQAEHTAGTLLVHWNRCLCVQP